jgi:SOS-response transcriptional repressor LexA
MSRIATRAGKQPDRFGLTTRQREVYAWMFESTCERGYQPSFRETMDRFGITSTHWLSCLLWSLRQKGWIGVRHPGQSRCLVFLRTPDGGEFRGFTPIRAPHPSMEVTHGG